MDHRIVSAILILMLVFGAAAAPHAQNSDSIRSGAKRTATPDPVIDTFTVPVFFDGQLCHWVRCIYQDSRGDLWFGTNHYGVMWYDGQSLEYVSEADGLGGGRINDIVEDTAGNVWFATYGGLSTYDGQSFTNFTLNTDELAKDVWSILIDRQGIFWVGTSVGVFQFDGSAFIPFPIPKAAVLDTISMLSEDRVTSIIEDRNGALWFGTDGFGVCRYDGESFTHFTTDNGLCDNIVSGLMEDNDGNIWIATMFGGISRFDGTSFTNFAKNGDVAGEEVAGPYQDTAGNIWFAVEHHGVYRYDGKTFTNFGEEDGLPTGGVIAILIDSEQRFWLGGWKGLFRYDGGSFFPVTKDGPW